MYFSMLNRPVATVMSAPLTEDPRSSLRCVSCHAQTNPSQPGREWAISKAAHELGAPRPFSSSPTQPYQVCCIIGPFSSSSDAKRISSPRSTRPPLPSYLLVPVLRKKCICNKLGSLRLVRIWRPAGQSELLPAISALFLHKSVDLPQVLFRI